MTITNPPRFTIIEHIDAEIELLEQYRTFVLERSGDELNYETVVDWWKGFSNWIRRTHARAQ